MAPEHGSRVHHKCTNCFHSFDGLKWVKMGPKWAQFTRVVDNNGVILGVGVGVVVVGGATCDNVTV